jgi:uncharacterized protein (TIGR02266 family)
VAGQDNRSGERATTSMRIKLKYPDIDTFIQKYAVNISRGGIFIATKQPKPVGTNVRFEFLLANAEGTSVIRGEGQVQWTREYDPEAPTRAHGMGVKFTRLDSDSQALVERALAWRAAQSAEVGTKRSDSTGISVAQALPAGATPEPMALPVTPTPSPLQSAPAEVPIERARPEHTRRVTIDDPPPKHDPPGEDEETLAGRPRDVVTREIRLPDAPAREENTGEIPLPDDSVKITLARHRRGRDGRLHIDQLDELAAEWGLSNERLERALKRARPRMVEATAELERLLRKPAKGTPPSKAEALAHIDELLARPSRPR